MPYYFTLAALAYGIVRANILLSACSFSDSPYQETALKKMNSHTNVDRTMQLIGSLLEQWAFTPPLGFEANLAVVLIVMGGAVSAVLIGAWLSKHRKPHASKSET